MVYYVHATACSLLGLEKMQEKACMKAVKEAYTKLLFSGISAGISVNTDRNQQASHMYIASTGPA